MASRWQGLLLMTTGLGNPSHHWGAYRVISWCLSPNHIMQRALPYTHSKIRNACTKGKSLVIDKARRSVM